MSKEAMKLALEAFQRLDLWLKVRYQVGLVGFELDAVKALEEALAKQEQGEPVAKLFGTLPVYDTTPQPRTWVELTKGEIESWDLPDKPTVAEFAWFVEAKIKEKNSWNS